MTCTNDSIMTDALSYIPLKARSPFSLAESALRYPDMLRLCQEYQIPAIAITDHHNLFGALEFAQTAAKAGIQPIIGCALTMASPLPPPPGQKHLLPMDQLFVYVQNETGYQNLLALVSDSYLQRDATTTPHVCYADLTGKTEGLIAVVGSKTTTLGQYLSQDKADKALQHLTTLKTLFPDRLYIEIARHDDPLELKVEVPLIDLAYTEDLPLLAAQDIFFATPDMVEAHGVLLGIADGKTISDPHKKASNPAWYFKSPDQLRLAYEDLPEALANTRVLAQRCAYMPEGRKPILPRFAEHGDEGDVLRAMAKAGLEARLTHVEGADIAAYTARLTYEVDMIIQMGFAGYFLIVADFIQWAKKQGIPVGPGRGSGAGSVVAWALTITDLDPMQLNLLFERFLNPERVSMPDFDIDFCQDRRDEVIAYVQQKYGHDRVAQIITFGKLQARAVLRDVGRVLEMPYGQIDRICKMVPNNPANPVTLQEALDADAQLQAIQQDEETSKLMDISLQLEGLYRHASTHAAGVVIGDRPLQELVPLYRDPRSTMPVTQFNMKYAETAGLVKFDFLGLKTLTVMQKACSLIASSYGVDIDLALLPLDDQKTYQMLARGDSMGVFQLESSGMRDVLRKMRPDRFTDIIALVALYRPGPMDNIPRYIACKHGQEMPDYLHPSLEGILSETFGVMIYQEQVMQIAQVLAGYSLGAADLLRRAMGKKIKAEMDAQQASFVEGAKANNVDGRQAADIFEQVAKFAGYGFNKSHAAAYALIAYQTAYLKANYPVAFLAASMTYDLQNTDKLGLFRQEAERLHIAVLPPDINASLADFAIEGNAIRYALAAIKGIGSGVAEHIVAERQAKGAYLSLADFCLRLAGQGLNKRTLEHLCYAGAFDSLGMNRATVAASLEGHITQSAKPATEQPGLFGLEEIQPSSRTPAMQHKPEWPPFEKLQHEFDALGFYLSAHPMDSYKGLLAKKQVVHAGQLQAFVAEKGPRRIAMAGILTGLKQRTSAKGSRYAFAQFTDATGIFEVLLFSEILGAYRPLLEDNAALLVMVDASMEGDTVKLLAQQVQKLDELASQTGMGMNVHIADQAALEGLAALLQRVQPGRAPLELTLSTKDFGDVQLRLPQGFQFSDMERQQVKQLPGVLQVVEF